MVENEFAVKAVHRAMWTLGDYAKVARDVLLPLGRELVDACRIAPGQRVLDVAAGSGNAAIPAAEAGATVVAVDLVPELLETAHQEAARHGVRLTPVEADAELLPFDDGEFDVVMSCIGVVFTPHHRRVADELVRVCRPAGRLSCSNGCRLACAVRSMACWVPGGSPGGARGRIATAGQRAAQRCG